MAQDVAALSAADGGTAARRRVRADPVDDHARGGGATERLHQDCEPARVLTGGGDGIGGAIATLFAAHGAAVEVVEIDPARVADAVSAEHDRVDVLVNNVGDYRPMVAFEESTPQSWQQMYDINLRHVFSATRAFVPGMIEAANGSIVNVHSVEGMRGFPRDPVYGAMKAAVAHFTTCLAVDLGRHGIRVNGIGTDLTQTPQVDYLTGYEDVEHLWESWAPVGRVGWPEDQARVALSLASEASGFVTGHNIPVDGGTKAAGGWLFSPRAGRFVNRSKHL